MHVGTTITSKSPSKAVFGAFLPPFLAKMSDPNPSLLWILVGVGAILGLIGFGMITSGIRDLEQAKASVDWPTSPGKVLSSSVKQKSDDYGDLHYRAKVVYEFKVNNTTYSSKRIAYGDYGSIYGASSDPSHAQKIVNRYPQDKNVTVSYMPNNPKECTLEVGVKENACTLPAIGIFVAFIGLIISIVGVVPLLK
jgi:hypothetical protein